MGQIRLKDLPGAKVLVRRSSQARRLSLRVSTLDGRVTLTLPPGVGEREAQNFADEKSDWVARVLEKQNAPVVVGIGATITVEGVERQITAGQGRCAKLLPSSISAPEACAGSAVEALLKSLARERFLAAVDIHASGLGRSIGRVTLRDTRSRWGSCSTQGNLMFSWRLILAPPAILDYVAAHEVAHLEHMDHSSRFWGVVHDLCPDHEALRQWLRREGAGLHQYRFPDD